MVVEMDVDGVSFNFMTQQLPSRSKLLLSLAISHPRLLSLLSFVVVARKKRQAREGRKEKRRKGSRRGVALMMSSIKTKNGINLGEVNPNLFGTPRDSEGLQGTSGTA